jgi:hypothetical protein
MSFQFNFFLLFSVLIINFSLFVVYVSIVRVHGHGVCMWSRSVLYYNVIQTLCDDNESQTVECETEQYALQMMRTLYVPVLYYFVIEPSLSWAVPIISSNSILYIHS